MDGYILKNVERLRERVRQACARAGRKPEEVTCVAVAKGHPASAVRSALEAGLGIIGENRVQEAQAKVRELSGLPVRWHLVGSLQTNKVRPAARMFEMIQSVDRAELASALQTECEKQGRSTDVLIQVEATGEPTKHGVRPDGAPDLARALTGFPNLRLRGLMAIGPLTEDPAKIRACFRTVRDLFMNLRRSGDIGETFDTLSMGMSDDFEWAIEEGSTLIRIGTLIFGPRL